MRSKRLSKWIGTLFALVVLGGCGTSPTLGQPEEPLPSPSPSPRPAHLRFFTMGDWGSATDNQKQVALALGSFCAGSGCDFGLLLGDNFYPSGVSSVADPQWQNTFEMIYSDPALQIPFYAVLGNHDHDGNPQAEIDYSPTQNRWRMPAAEYQVDFPAGSQSPLLTIFVIDSGYGEARDASQVAALVQTIDASNSTWKILALHHPLYSNGLHGDTVALRDSLLPALCHKVDLVLSGHDHIFSHLQDSNGCGLQQWVVGTGGMGLYTTNPDPRALYSESSFGFASLTVDENSLTLVFHRSDGSSADAFTLSK